MTQLSVYFVTRMEIKMFVFLKRDDLNCLEQTFL